MYWKIYFALFGFTLISMLVLPYTANGISEVETSENQTDRIFPEEVEQSFLSETEGGQSSDGIIGEVEYPTSPSTSSTVGVKPNMTTKPTWIQRIPKKKPKPAGE